MSIRTFWMAVLIGGLVAGPGVSEAKRIGAKSTKSSANTKADAEEAKPSAGITISPRMRAPLAAAAAGTAAGSAVAAAKSEPEQPPADKPAEAAALKEQQREEQLLDLERKGRIEEATQKAEQAAAARKALEARQEAERRLAEEAAESRRRAEADRQATLRAKAIERDRSCVIKPVMTEAEIAHCKWAWSVPPPG